MLVASTGTGTNQFFLKNTSMVDPSGSFFPDPDQLLVFIRILVLLRNNRNLTDFNECIPGCSGMANKKVFYIFTTWFTKSKSLPVQFNVPVPQEIFLSQAYTFFFELR